MTARVLLKQMVTDLHCEAVHGHLSPEKLKLNKNYSSKNVNIHFSFFSLFSLSHQAENLISSVDLTP